MVKTYLRFELKATHGVVASPECNVLLSDRGSRAICGSLEEVKVWSISSNTCSLSLVADDGTLPRPAVTRLCLVPRRGAKGKEKEEEEALAAGYGDGRIILWSLGTTEPEGTFHGHRKAITALSFNERGDLLASGSKDTEIVVWDPLAKSGVCRLRGHKGPVRSVAFLKKPYLASCSTDTFVKVWDVDRQFCVQTVVLGPGGEGSSLCFSSSLMRLAVGCSGSAIRMYRVRGDDDDDGDNGEGGQKDQKTKSPDAGGPAGPLEPIGTLQRQLLGKRAVETLKFVEGPGCRLLLCQSSGKVVEVFRQRTEKELKKKLRRKQQRLNAKKAKRKGGKKAGAAAAEENAEGEARDGDSGPAKPGEATAEDEFLALAPLTTTLKVRSADLCLHRGPSASSPSSPSSPSAATEARVLVSTASNSLETYRLGLGGGGGGARAGAGAGPGPLRERERGIHLPGSRAGVRSVALSSDDAMFLTACAGQAKVWNARTGACVRTLALSGYGLCGLFLPGDRHAVVGTKEGRLELFDLTAAARVQRVQAHAGVLWGIHPRPDRKGFATGGGDRCARFWEYEVRRGGRGGDGAASLGLVLAKEMKMMDEVLSVCHSANGRWVAVGLLDATIKVFFEDSLKFYLSLYGHKLPVMCMDISDDSALLASGGADKDLKIWGLDFGDCHKSLFAHEGSIMAIRFCPGTHYCFTCAKDKRIKFWDCDKFEQVMTLSAHHAEVCSLAVGSQGNLLLSCSNDRSIRVWEQTDEMVFVHLEKRRELEEELDKEELQAGAPSAIKGSGLPSAPLESAPVATGGSNQSLVGAERLMEAMEVAKVELERWEEYHKAVAKAKAREANLEEDSKEVSGLQMLIEGKRDSERVKADDIPEPETNTVLGGLSPAGYIFRELKEISASERSDALLNLPFKYAQTLIGFCKEFLEERLNTESAVQTAYFLAAAHREQILQSSDLLEKLQSIRRVARKHLREQRDVIGENSAGLRLLLKANESKKASYMRGDLAAPEARDNSGDSLFVIDRAGQTAGKVKRRKMN